MNFFSSEIFSFWVRVTNSNQSKLLSTPYLPLLKIKTSKFKPSPIPFMTHWTPMPFLPFQIKKNRKYFLLIKNTSPFHPFYPLSNSYTKKLFLKTKILSCKTIPYVPILFRLKQKVSPFRISPVSLFKSLLLFLQNLQKILNYLQPWNAKLLRMSITNID